MNVKEVMSQNVDLLLTLASLDWRKPMLSGARNGVTPNPDTRGVIGGGIFRRRVSKEFTRDIF
jgi:hypothetical protein